MLMLRSGLAPLTLAAHFGHTETALALIEKGADVNATDQYGYTALQYAAKYGHAETVLALIANGADVNAAGQYGYTALHYAAINGHAETVLALINAGADVNATNSNREKPLHLAAYKGQTEIAVALIEKGAGVNAADIQGRTPLQIATMNGKNEISRAIEHPLHYAARISDVKTVKALIGRGYDLQAKLDGKIPLEHAIAADNLNVAKYLLALTKANFADLIMPEDDNSTTRFLKLATSKHDTSAASALTVAGNEIQNEVATKLSSIVQSTVDIHNSKIYFAKALIGMPTTSRAKAMVKFMMFNLTFKIKGSYRDAILIARDLVKSGTTNKGKTRPSLCPDVIGIILNFAGLMPEKTSIDAIAHPYYKALNSSQVKTIEVAVRYPALPKQLQLIQGLADQQLQRKIKPMRES